MKTVPRRKKKPLTRREVNTLLHDTLLHEALDQMGAPTEQSGGKLSAYGRLRRIAPTLLADKVRLNWLMANGAYVSHSRDGEVCNVWFSQDPDDDSNGAVPVEGYPQKCYHDPREAIDAAIKHGQK